MKPSYGFLQRKFNDDLQDWLRVDVEDVEENCMLEFLGLEECKRELTGGFE